MVRSVAGERKSSPYKVVGTSPRRHDALDKVTGRARYGADIHLPGMLYGLILRSPHAHAVIKRIDTIKAKALPGVRAVVTASGMASLEGMIADLGEGGAASYGYISNNCLAADKVLYKGHAVAAVAAISPEIAEQALSLINVDYEVLPPVMDGRDAIKPGAPVLHPGLKPAGEVGPKYANAPNVAGVFKYQIGDADKALKEADVVVEHETHTALVHQGYIEPHSATATWDENGQITVWSSSQGHFMVREMTSTLLGVPVSKVKVIPMEIGGGFGGKTLVYLEPVAALLSRESGGHPVKITMTRTEVFEATGPTSGSHIKVKLGATKDGKLVAASAHLLFESGAYPSSPVALACRCIFAPYDVPNAAVEGVDAVVNKPRTAAYRAPGSPPAAFAMETAVDELCAKLGMDPLEFRLLNGSKEGTRQVAGPAFARIGNLETVRAAKESDQYRKPLKGAYRGRGVASGFWFNASGPASAVAVVNADGTVSLNEGSVDIGGSRTAMAIQLAEVLGIPAEDVKPTVADTDTVGYTSLTGGSSATFKSGWATYEAGQDVKRQLIARAARIWNAQPDDVEYADGTLRHKSDPALKLTFKQVAAKLNSSGGPIVGRGTVEPRGAGAAFATHVVDVEVDPETGKVTILRYTAAQDVGRAIYPPYVEGQIHGAVAQGVGWALNEEYVYDPKGRMLNPSFLDYRMPTALDLPNIEAVVVEVPNPGHPFGVRGVGEVGICPPLAAVCNAVSRAIGVRVNSVPMSPPRVLAALKSAGSAKPRKNGRKA